jgi:hypothetical protein
LFEEVAVENEQTQLARILTGAAIGAGFAYLFLTRRGKNLLESAEPWLDEVIRDMQRLRGTAAKVRDAVDEGRRSFEAVANLGSFNTNASREQPWTSEPKH